MLHIISLGAGVQSSTMALMAAHGEITPMPDCAIFADTQGEPAAVYEHLRWLMSPNVLPFPVHVVTAGNLWESATTVRRTRDGERTYIETSIPVHMAEGLRRGMGQRHCTRDYKIEPINRKVRDLLGRKRVPSTSPVLAEMWIGISTDEADRMKPNHKPWIKSRWPLIEAGMSRADCLAWMARHEYPTPPRSACTFCPFRDDESWGLLTDDEFRDVVLKETELQAAYEQASAMRGKPFLHDSRVPLSEVKFEVPALALRARLGAFRNECEGMCGV